MKKTLTLIGIVMTILLASCKPREYVVYMQDVPTTDSTFTIPAPKQITFRPGDKLYIYVNSSMPELATVFNVTVAQNTSTAANQTSGSRYNLPYTIDSEGNIDFPILGTQHIAGMTREEVAKSIKKQILEQELLKDVIVTVEYSNLTFSILGEVGAAGRYNFDKDCITLLEAISMAKDLGIMGQRNNVLVTRQGNDGQQHTYRVDLRNTQSLYQSPVFYVQQNDVIYVEPNSTRARQRTTNGNSILTPSFWATIAGLTTSIIAITKK